MLPVHPAILIALAVLLVAFLVLLTVAGLCRAAAIGDRQARRAIDSDDHTIRFEHPWEIRQQARDERRAAAELRPQSADIVVLPVRRPR